MQERVKAPLILRKRMRRLSRLTLSMGFGDMRLAEHQLVTSLQCRDAMDGDDPAGA